MNAKETPIHWIRVAAASDLPNGRVMTVTAGTKTLALCHSGGQYAAMDNHCPHQGGPLGEGLLKLVKMVNAGCVAPGTAGILIR